MHRSGKHGLGWRAFEPSPDVSRDLCANICYAFLIIMSFVLQIRVMVVGLGAGLLPMFIHNHLPVQCIQVPQLTGL